MTSTKGVHVLSPYVQEQQMCWQRARAPAHRPLSRTYLATALETDTRQSTGHADLSEAQRRLHTRALDTLNRIQDEAVALTKAHLRHVGRGRAVRAAPLNAPRQIRAEACALPVAFALMQAQWVGLRVGVAFTVTQMAAFTWRLKHRPAQQAQPTDGALGGARPQFQPQLDGPRSSAHPPPLAPAEGHEAAWMTEVHLQMLHTRASLFTVEDFRSQMGTLDRASVGAGARARASGDGPASFGSCIAGSLGVLTQNMGEPLHEGLRHDLWALCAGHEIRQQVTDRINALIFPDDVGQVGEAIRRGYDMGWHNALRAEVPQWMGAQTLALHVATIVITDTASYLSACGPVEFFALSPHHLLRLDGFEPGEAIPLQANDKTRRPKPATVVVPHAGNTDVLLVCASPGWLRQLKPQSLAALRAWAKAPGQGAADGVCGLPWVRPTAADLPLGYGAVLAAARPRRGNCTQGVRASQTASAGPNTAGSA
jgi:hypothetical protein